MNREMNFVKISSINADSETRLMSLLKECHKVDHYVCGYVESKQIFDHILELHRVLTGCSFVRRSLKSSSLSKRVFLTHNFHGIRLNDGTPFLIGSSSALECHRGKRNFKLGKEKKPPLPPTMPTTPSLRDDDHDYISIVPPLVPVNEPTSQPSASGNEIESGRATSRRNKTSKKVNCPATLFWLEILRFEQLFVAPSLHKNQKTKKIKELQPAIDSRLERGQFSTRYYVRLPLEGAHANHPVGSRLPEAGQSEPVHPLLINKIRELVFAGYTHRADVEFLLGEFVDKEVQLRLQLAEPIARSNRSFFPSKKDLVNHIARAVRQFQQQNQPQPSQASTSGGQLRDLLRELMSLTYMAEKLPNGDDLLQVCQSDVIQLVLRMRAQLDPSESTDTPSRAKRRRCQTSSTMPSAVASGVMAAADQVLFIYEG